MTVKNSIDDDEVIREIEACGIELSDDQKRHIKEQRSKLKQLSDYDLRQLHNEVLRLCRVPTAAGKKTALRAAATAYLSALERKAAKSQRGKIDTRAIYAARRQKPSVNIPRRDK